MEDVKLTIHNTGCIRYEWVITRQWGDAHNDSDDLDENDKKNIPPPKTNLRYIPQEILKQFESQRIVSVWKIINAFLSKYFINSQVIHILIANLKSTINPINGIKIHEIPEEAYDDSNDDYISRCLNIVKLFDMTDVFDVDKIMVSNDTQKMCYLFGIIYKMDHTYKNFNFIRTIINILSEFKKISEVDERIGNWDYELRFYICIKLKQIDSDNNYITLLDYNFKKINEILEKDPEYKNFIPEQIIEDKCDSQGNILTFVEIKDIRQIIGFFHFKAITNSDKEYYDLIFKDNIFEEILKPYHIEYFFGKKKIDVVIYV
jgi:hypothetical protein